MLVSLFSNFMALALIKVVSTDDVGFNDVKEDVDDDVSVLEATLGRFPCNNLRVDGWIDAS